MHCVCPQGGGERHVWMYDHGMHVLVVLFPSWGGVGRSHFLSSSDGPCRAGTTSLLCFFSDEHVRRAPIPYCFFPAQYIMDWVHGARPLYPSLSCCLSIFFLLLLLHFPCSFSQSSAVCTTISTIV